MYYINGGKFTCLFVWVMLFYYKRIAKYFIHRFVKDAVPAMIIASLLL